MSVAPRQGVFPGFRTFGFIIIWFVGLLYLGYSGALKHWSGLGPLSALQVAMFAPIALFFAVYALASPFRRFVHSLDPVALAAVQVIRIFGAAHFISWGYGLMSGTFSFAVGGGNFIICLIALYTVYRTAYRLPGWRGWLYALTILGLAEFAMTIALANLGYFWRPLPFDPPLASGGYTSFLTLPISIFPSFLIPLFMVIHCATFMRLLNGPK